MSILDRFQLNGRVVIVTGASSGLGVAFARGFAEAGADVVLAARRRNKLDETAALVTDAGRRTLCVETDVVDPEQIQTMVDSAIAEFGRVDVLINNAASAPRARQPGRLPTSSAMSSTSTSTARTGLPRPVAG